jgi:hypothetical protein
MRFCAGFILWVMGVVAPMRAETPSLPTRIAVAPLKTSIYIGSVKLVTGAFDRQGNALSTTYEAKVTPWFFWSETGHITISLSESDFAALAKRQTVEFKGDATNHKNKPRTVTGRAQPADATSGKIKVRVMADGIELIFNGTYRFE